MNYMDQLLAIDIQMRTEPSKAIKEFIHVLQKVLGNPNDYSTCLFKLYDYWNLLYLLLMFIHI